MEFATYNTENKNFSIPDMEIIKELNNQEHKTLWLIIELLELELTKQLNKPMKLINFIFAEE